MGDEINFTNFLNGIIVFETEIFKNIFLNLPPPQSTKQGKLLYNVFKINCCKQLFEPQENNPIQNIIWYLSEGLGYYIHGLRQKEIADKQICETVLHSRNSFLKEYALPVSYRELVSSKKCIRMYDSVQKGLIDLLN